MIYLIGQMLFCLALAALLGLVMGWLLRGVGSKKIAAERLELSQKLAQCDSSLQLCRSEKLALERRQALAHLVADPETESEADEKGEANLPLVIKAAEAGERDELQRIHGIGAVLERRLNALGVTTFKQIMALSQTDIVSLSEKIGAFPDRIERDGWLASAAKEQAKKAKID